MVLFKLKVEDRTHLYFNRFKYKLIVREPNLSFASRAKSITDFIDAIDTARSRNIWRKPIPDLGNEAAIEAIINYRIKYDNDDRVALRKEGDSLTIYTNEIAILNEVHAFKPDAKLTEVNQMPIGIMTFKRKPPAKYRAYMSNRKMSNTFKEDFIEYLSRTPDIRPSNSMYSFLHRHVKYPRESNLWDKYYIDYDDDKNLMMLHLLFPTAIGKTYKLEKKI